MVKKDYRLKINEKLIIIFVLATIVTQGVGSPYFYFNWIAGSILISFSVFRILLDNKITKSSIYVFLLSTMWLLFPIINVTGNKIKNMGEHYKYLILYIFYIVVSIIVVSALNKLSIEKKDSIMLFSNWLWTIVNLIAYVIFLFFNPLYNNDTFSGIMENRNIYAVTTTILVSYLIFFKKNYSRRKQVNLLIVISFLLVLSTASVKGFVGWLLIYILSNFYSLDISITKKRRNQFIIILLGFLLIMILVITDNPIIFRIERFLMVFTAPNELRMSESAYLRSYFIHESINVIKDNPFDGIGIRNSRYYLIPPLMQAEGATEGMYSHNNYLEILLSGGIFAFLMYYIPFFISMYKLHVKRYTSNMTNYLFVLGLYKLFIDFGSVNYDVLIVDTVLVAILYGQFFREKQSNQVNLN